MNNSYDIWIYLRKKRMACVPLVVWFPGTKSVNKYDLSLGESLQKIYQV